MRLPPAASSTSTCSGASEVTQTASMSSATSAEGLLDELATRVTRQLTGSEMATLVLDGEDSDFVRFNRARVRQAGSVSQLGLELSLIDGQRSATSSTTLSGKPEADGARVDAMLASLRDQVVALLDDPHLVVNTEPVSTRTERLGSLPDAEEVIDRVRTTAGAHDLVGIYQAGTTVGGFANSLGQRNWFRSDSFGLDWSMVHSADRATKQLYAGTVWDPSAAGTAIEHSVAQLEALARPTITLAPGRYRAYLAPAAMVELTDMLSWGGFSERAHRTRTTPLLSMISDDARFDSRVHMAEATAQGTAAPFQSSGFLRPDRVQLIEDGRYADTLVSPRSAIEFGAKANGADEWEAPESLSVAPGDIAAEAVLDTLGTGLHISNLWYLNFSDRPACRTTGMTRFATFWVEDGEIVAPAEVMRFDDSIIRLLGENLVGLTDTSELVLDMGSYGSRSTGSTRVPGAIVEDMTFTL